MMKKEVTSTVTNIVTLTLTMTMTEQLGAEWQAYVC